MLPRILPYSGTIAIAREAAFTGIPSIALSRLPGTNRDESWVSDWLRSLLAYLWHTRAVWAREGHWLSVNLPPQRPKGLRAARIGRDKIAKHVDVINSAGPVRTLQTRSGRDHDITGADDENGLIIAGFAFRDLAMLVWSGELAVGASGRLSPTEQTDTMS